MIARTAGSLSHADLGREDCTSCGTPWTREEHGVAKCCDDCGRRDTHPNLPADTPVHVHDDRKPDGEEVRRG